MIIINNIINWCNTNQGFMSAALSLFAVFVSVVAVWISIRGTRKQNSIALFEKRYGVYIALDFIIIRIKSAYEHIERFEYNKKEEYELKNEKIRDYIFSSIGTDSNDTKSKARILLKNIQDIKYCEFLFSKQIYKSTNELLITISELTMIMDAYTKYSESDFVPQIYENKNEVLSKIDEIEKKILPRITRKLNL